jgi:hypothetical protein
MHSIPIPTLPGGALANRGKRADSAPFVEPVPAAGGLGAAIDPTMFDLLLECSWVPVGSDGPEQGLPW